MSGYDTEAVRGLKMIVNPFTPNHNTGMQY